MCVNYFLNLTLFARMTAVIFSGVLISQEAIPALTMRRAAEVEADPRWTFVHDRLSDVVLIPGPAMKLAGRILAMAAAVVLFIGLTGRERRRRPPWPQPFGVIRFGREAVLIGLVTWGGRKVLWMRI